MNAQIDVTNVRIETERLILRPWREEDLHDLYEYACVEGVGEMAGWNHHKSVEESQVILDSFIRHKKTFALELKENGRVVGSLGIEELNPDWFDHAKLYGRELGYVLSKPFWGRGLMPEAVEAAIRYCFDELGYGFLTCGHFVRNGRSRRVIEKTGFVYLKDVLFETRYGTEEPTRHYVLYNPKFAR